MKNRPYAFFDLDYTLIPHDTLLLFCNYVLKKERWRSFFVFFFAPFVPLAALRLVRGAALKRAFLSFLWGMPVERLDRYARDFVETCVVPEIFPEVRAKLEEHKRAGDRVILNTASPEFYVRYIADHLGVDDCFATRLDLKDPLPMIPNYLGRNNKRMEKIHRMREILPAATAAWLAAHPAAGAEDAEYRRQAIAGASAYSDSPADLPMLMLSEHCFVVHPGNKLRSLADLNAWTVLTPARGYEENRTRYIHSVRQLFGLYGARDLRQA